MRPGYARPPLWLAASAIVGAIATAFGVQRWAAHFVTDPNAEDFRLHVLAARVGLTHGWSHIYDIALQRAAAAGLSGEGSLVDSMHLFISPPPAAWLVAPIAWLPVSDGYLLWTMLNVGLLIAAGLLVIPAPPFARVTILLASFALWPVHYQFWLGQWVVATLALTAIAWWLLERDRWLLAGIALSLAFCAKPQDVALVPVALLVSGRWRPVAAFIACGALLALASLASLGRSGLDAWFSAVAVVRADPFNSPVTWSTLVGRGGLATAIEAALLIAALALVFIRRDRLDLVFAIALVGSTASATYLHEDDLAILVLAGWLILRDRLSWPHRITLLLGIAAAQCLSIGLALPILLWQPAWLAVLGWKPRSRVMPQPVETRC